MAKSLAHPPLHPRYITPRLQEALADSPVVLVHGPRQCGKSTLAQQVGGGLGYAYLTLDDAPVLAAAQADPVGFVAELPERVILDEIQRAPELFLPLKATVDRDRRPGRFLLTGSSQVLLLPRLADTLAGRMALLRLHPLAQCELAHTPSTFVEDLFAGRLRVRGGVRQGRALAGRIAGGGFPAALARASEIRRSAWYADYLETLIQRDVRELARITALHALPRLLELLAGQTAHLLNLSALAAPLQLSRPTLRDYVTLLERLFLLEELPPWFSNRLSRLIKTPKLHLADTGLACALLGLDAASLHADRALLGQLAETFVLQELRRMASWHGPGLQLHHFRDREGAEVDLVLSRRGGLLAGIEVKASATVTGADFKGLHKLASAAGAKFAAGLVLHDGERVLPFGEKLWAVPFAALWGGAA